MSAQWVSKHQSGYIYKRAPFGYVSGYMLVSR
jgi:hypothetical protein